jgi:CRISPR-associated protein Cas2
MVKQQLYLIAYDIESDKRRNKVAHLLEDRGGERVNYSVFEIMVESGKFPRFKQKIVDIIDEKRDRVVIYPVCRTCFSKAEYIPDKGPPPPKALVSV